VLKEVIAVQTASGTCLHLRSEDGVDGVVDVASLVSFRGVFEPLLDPAYFAQVRVDPEFGTVLWPNGADPDPDLLYSRLTGSTLVSG
jgi:hypothetical protein